MKTPKQGKKTPFKNGFRIRYYVDGKQKFKFFPAEKELDADLFLKEFNGESKKDSLGVREDERIFLLSLRRELRKAGVSLDEVQGSIFNLVSSKKTESPKASEAYESFIEDWTKRNLRTSTLDQYKLYIPELYEDRDKPINEFTREEVLQFILSRYQNENSRGIVKRSLTTFFRYCQNEKKWCSGWQQPLTWTKPREDQEAPQIFNPETFQAVLNFCPLTIVSGMALMGFCGIRPQELISKKKPRLLRWSDIDFRRKKIHIPGAVSKIRKPRTISEVPPNVWKWLAVTPKEMRKGNIILCNYDNFRKSRKNAFEKAREELKKKPFKIDWPKDVLRHSTASYGFYYKSFEWIVDALGHEEVKTFFKYYKASASRAAAAKWYAIHPI